MGSYPGSCEEIAEAVFFLRHFEDLPDPVRPDAARNEHLRSNMTIEFRKIAGIGAVLPR